MLCCCTLLLRIPLVHHQTCAERRGASLATLCCTASPQCIPAVLHHGTASTAPQAVCGRGDVDGDFVTPLCISQCAVLQAPHLLLAAGANRLLGRLVLLTAPLPLLLCALAGRLWARHPALGSTAGSNCACYF